MARFRISRNDRPMNRPPRPLPEPLRTRPFFRSEAMSLGVTRRRLQAHDVISLGPGIYAPRTLALSENLVTVARACAWTKGVVSGVSAAHLHSLPLPHWLASTDPLAPTHLSFEKKDRASRAPEIYARTTTIGPLESEVQQMPGTSGREYRIMTRARTWLSLINDVPFDHSVAILDHLLRIPRAKYEAGRTGPYCTLEELAHLLAQHPHMQGIVTARRVLELARVGSDSVPETRCRLGFHAAGLPEPKLNFTLRDDLGNAIATPDFWWPGLNVAAEYDGSSHRELAKFTGDRNKDERLRKLGIQVVRLYKTDLPPLISASDPDRILARLAESPAVELVARALG